MPATSPLTPQIGWTSHAPPADGATLGPSLVHRGGHLLWEGIDLASLFQPGHALGLDLPLPSPLEIAYLPAITRQIRELVQTFDELRAELRYGGDFLYAYASKANTAEEIVRTTLRAGAHHEMSSDVDVDIARLMIERGHLPQDRWIFANGFKPPGSRYSENLIELARSGARVLPIFDALDELEPFIEAGVALSVGLRQKTYGLHKESGTDPDGVDSRFGMSREELQEAARRIGRNDHLTLRLHHAMLGSQMTAPASFGAGLEPALEDWAALHREHPTLDLFDFGGGLPGQLTLDNGADVRGIARAIVETALGVAARHGLEPPHLVGELGRYTTASHAAHLFRVVATKDNLSPQPWYLIDGSIMTSFPDIWALGEHFAVLPLNHLDRPFHEVRLGGITCDSDDIYPQRSSQARLLLPQVDAADDLHVGFFFVGAYQEMLGGVRGSKHCVLPEAAELLLEERDESLEARLIQGHRTVDVLDNLGYI